jgi:D-glycero-D-manno-heptose 1,7-bisphosphate phosphatase
MNARRPAAFLDRDGVVNIDHGYVARIEDFEFVPGALDASRALAQRGFALVVITNQSGIGRGLYTEADYQVLTAWMRAQFAAAGATLAGVYHCPHHPTQGHGAYRMECGCRKPAPGMLLQATQDCGLDLARSVLFGDKLSDLQAAATAGVPQRVLLGTDGLALPAMDASGLATLRFRSLADAVFSAELRALSAHANA